jgi:protein-S-isoprenylcysteine O-methyltransferase Ste14
MRVTMQHDIGIYIAHAGFFLSFVIVRRIAAMAPRDQGGTRVVASEAATAPASRILFVAHVGAFFLLYFGIAAAVFGPPPRLLFPSQILMGALLIAVVVAILSDLRARAEETLLLRVYGETYAKYCGRTRRFIPAVY